ncbi:hypothetical protein CLU79DRAFT_231601 [Phycomyces nitens]|nr:hypothetical protein CLU79DRAFT_231601 [Phycomyces nitens]
MSPSHRPFHQRSLSDSPHRLRDAPEITLLNTPPTSCAQCRQPIPKSAFDSYGVFTSSTGQTYHSSCVRCVGCWIQQPQGLQTREAECYDYHDRPYCRFHYSFLKGTSCSGCLQTILKKFVKPSQQEERWHPECYMIQKHWRVCLKDVCLVNTSSLDPISLYAVQDAIDQQCTHIWSDMAAFEASSAACISDILMHLAALNYPDTIRTANHLLLHIHQLFLSLDHLRPIVQKHDQTLEQDTSSLLSQQLVLFFDHLSHSHTQLNHIITCLAYALKDLMRLALVTALSLEHKHNEPNTIKHFLDALDRVSPKDSLESADLLSPVSKNLFQPVYASLRRLELAFQTKSIPIPKAPLSVSQLQPTPQKSNQPQQHQKQSSSLSLSMLAQKPADTVQMGHIKRAKALREFTKEPTVRNRSISTISSISSSRYAPRLVSKPPSPLSSLVNQDKFIRDWATGQLHLLGWSSEILGALLEAKKPSLWGKLKTHMRVGTLKPPADSSLLPTFGVPLESISSDPLVHLGTFPLPGLRAAFDSRSRIPNCVQQCILAMLSKDLSIEGIFRKNGNIRQLKIMHDAIDAGQDTDSTFYTNESPVQLAALLKRFLRELPEPLMTHRLYSLFMSSMTTPEDTQNFLHLACCLLPKPNRDLLFLLLALLSWTTTFKALNRMDSYNLACVVAPNILYYTSKDLNSTLQSYSQEDEIQVVRLLIEHQDQLCMIPSGLRQELEQILPISQDTSSKHFLKTYNQVMQLSRASESTPTLPTPPLPQYPRRRSSLYPPKSS